MKSCKSCGNSFVPLNSLHSYCSKVCKRKSNYISRRDDHYSVYYLPEEHYVGITNSMYDRMQHHRHKGKIIEGYEVIAKFEREVDAMWLEIMFHQRGYHGFRTKLKY